MKALITVATLSAVLTFPAAAQVFKHEDGATYQHIAKCLFEEFGFEEGKHFRKNPVEVGKIQFNEVAIMGDGLGQYRKDIGVCWKAPKAPVQKAQPKQQPLQVNPGPSRSQVIEARSFK